MTDNFYLIGSCDSDKMWRGTEQLCNDVVDEHGNDVMQDLAYGDGPRNASYWTGVLRKGMPAPIQFHDVFRLVSLMEETAKRLKVGGDAQLLKLIVREDARELLLFRPVCSLNVVDFSRSDIEKWPSGTDLEPWDDPRGSLFLQPAIKWSEVPKDIGVFRLMDWPGPSNIVFSEEYKRQFESCMSGYATFRRILL